VLGKDQNLQLTYRGTEDIEMIAQERISGNWNRVVGAVKKNFGQITNDDLQRVEGNVDQLIGLIQSKTGRSREQIDAFLNDCCSSAEGVYDEVTGRMAEYTDAASEAFREGYDRLATAANRGYDDTMRAISRRPVESLAVAAGAGLLFGLVVGLSMTSRRR
jgi:uncharacterized protein YjbJ (UPF0337 family)